MTDARVEQLDVAVFTVPLEKPESDGTLTWDSTTVANGTHTLSAVAHDAAGNTTTAASVTVTTSNATAPPPLNIHYRSSGGARIGAS